MSLYDLNKDMLIYLISTIRKETIKEFYNKLDLFSSEEAEFLFDMAGQNFYKEQEDRFILINKGDDPSTIDKNGIMCWCKNIVKAVHLKNFLLNHNQKAVIVMDDCNDETPFVVITDYTWEQYTKFKIGFK